MMDQNKLYDQTQEQTPEQATSPFTSSAETLPQTPTSQPPPSSPTVIIPSGTDNVPKWFYVVFGITLLAFLAGTFLLVSTIKQRQTGILQTSPSPSPLPTVTTATGEITPSPPPPEIIDPATLKLNNQGASDEVMDLEVDLENTDLSPIDQIIATLDEQMGFSSEGNQ